MRIMVDRLGNLRYQADLCGGFGLEDCLTKPSIPWLRPREPSE
jgi:hypothetical protein